MVSKEIEAAWSRLEEVFLATAKGDLVSSREIAFFQYLTSKGKVVFRTRKNQKHEYIESFSSLEDLLSGRFVLSHGYYLVNLDLIHEVSGRAGDYKLHFQGIQRSVPISPAFEKRLKKHLGVSTFEHPVPDNPRARFLRQNGLVEFGVPELKKLDKSDPEAVQAFRKMWDLKRFPYSELERFFKRYSMEGLNIRSLMRNMLWQRFRWIQEGIAKPHRGNIRTLWYEIQAGIEHHPELGDKVHSGSFYEELETMVGRDRLFRYKDIGFFDVRSRYRGMGTKNVPLMLISEKEGNFFDVRDMAQEYGMTYGCTKGQPSLLMMEYLGDELREAGSVTQEDVFHVFLITDFDWAGKSIEVSFIRKLKKLSEVKQVKVHQLIHAKDLMDEELELARTKAVSFTYNQEGQAVPWGNSSGSISGLTKARKWFKKVGDPRLLTKAKIGGKWVHTIWKFSSDAIGWRKKDRLFRKAVEKVLDRKGKSQRDERSPIVSQRITLASMKLWHPKLPKDLK